MPCYLHQLQTHLWYTWMFWSFLISVYIFYGQQFPTSRWFTLNGVFQSQLTTDEDHMYKHLTGEHSCLINEYVFWEHLMLKHCSMLKIEFVQSAKNKQKGKTNKLITNSLMERSPSWEVANCAATQDLTSILCNTKVHYRIHKGLSLVPILSHINPIHTIPSYLSKIHFNIVHHLHLGLPSGLFPSGLFPPISYMHSSSPPHSCYMFCLSYPPWLYHSNYTLRRVQLMNLPIVQFSPPSCQYIFHPNILLSVLISNTLSICSSLNVREKVSHPIKIIGKIIISYILIFMSSDSRREVKRFWTEW
jgi:hypothetical protein